MSYDLSKEIRLEELKPIDPSFSEALQQVDPRLRQVLPAYMVPSLYISVQSLPFANSYRSDRGALKDSANRLKESEVQDIARREEKVE